MSFTTRQKGIGGIVNGITGDLSIVSSDGTVTVFTDVPNSEIDLSIADKIERKFPFLFSSTFPLSLGTYLNFDEIRTIDFHVKAAFNAGVEFSVGTLGSPELLIPKTDTDGTQADSVFSVDVFYTFLADTEIFLFIYNSPTQGTGEVFVDII